MNKKTKILNTILITSLLIASVLSYFKKGDALPKSLAAVSVLETPERMHIEARLLPAEEIPDGVALMANQQGYNVLTLTLENGSVDQYELKKESIDLNLADRKKIMKKVKRSALTRGILFRVASLFFWPMMIPSTIDSFVTFHRNHSLKNRIHAVMLKKEGEILLPYSAVHRYLFVEGDEVPKIAKVEILNCHTQRFEVYNVEIT